jgi:putative peptidoglycan lipid II flippase
LTCTLPSKAGRGTSAQAPRSAELAGLAADSRTAAAWTLVSRVTGFGRVASIAAVLGPTYFGNLFQTANILPNILYELLIGSLITAMLVPALTRVFTARDQAGASRLASGFFGILILVLALVVLLSVMAAPLLVALLTVAVEDAAIRGRLHDLGWPLLALLMPQVLLYGIIGTCAAVQNARRRYALAAGAPALENVGTMAVMAASALIFGVGTGDQEVTAAHVLFLGAGSTLAVALHAAVQWWGAYRAGVPLLPRAGWRDPDVRRIARLAVPSSAYSTLSSVSYLGLLVVASRVPGGASALQIGLNVLFLPGALCARPIAAAQLPLLSHSFDRGDMAAFGRTYRAALALTGFVALPASLLCLAIPETLGRAVSFGEMAGPAGVALVSAALGSLGLGILGESALRVLTSASYACGDAILPLRAMMLHALLSFAGMAVAFGFMQGTAILWTLGLFTSAGNLLAAVFLHVRRRRMLPTVAESQARRLLGDLAASAAAIGAAVLVANWLGHGADTGYQRFGIALAAIMVSGVCYLFAQWLRGSEELRELLGGIGQHGRAPVPKRASVGSTTVDRGAPTSGVPG